MTTKKGLKINRIFTKKGENPLDNIEYETRESVMRSPTGEIKSKIDVVEVPKKWSQVATDILAQKYFRKTGVPQKDGSLNGETSIRQVVTRLAKCWRDWGEKYHYFATAEDAQSFEDEIKYMLVNQIAAPNSPQWFNTGLANSYNIRGTAQGHHYIDEKTGELHLAKDAYSRPQPHACFIQSVSDDMINKGGIFDLLTREARVFKFGSGSGTNFSALRGKGEKLSGGGESSGMMSFMSIFDKAAGSIKSGGTTRRAAKMICIDIDHPDIEQFIQWKVIEEQKVAAIVTGSAIMKKHLDKIIHIANESKGKWEENKELKNAIAKAKNNNIPDNFIKKCLELAEQGIHELDLKSYSTYFEDEAYATVDGQNANNSIRISNEFLKAVENNESWQLKARTTGETMKTIKARDLWDKLVRATWTCADPGVQFDSTINEWHTCPAGGKIKASNPCSEYMFLDDTACNLASINLLKFYNERTGKIDLEKYRHTIRIWTIVLEISVLMAQFVGEKMAQNSYDYRSLGLGYANIGALLMTMGLPYDSDEGRAVAGSLTAILTGESYSTSAELANAIGPFNKFEENRDAMLRVVRNHRRAAYAVDETEYENLTVKPMHINTRICPEYLLKAARTTWDVALTLGEKHGYRNAQVTVIAPTGTIGLVMDCDTTGVEPDFALVKFKKLVGGGYFKIVNQSIKPSLRTLGYSTDHIRDIEHCVIGNTNLEESPFVNTATLTEKGFTKTQITAAKKQLKSAFEIGFAFAPWVFGDKFCKDTLKISEQNLNNPFFSLLEHIGFTQKEIATANEFLCGTGTLENTPHLKIEHLPVFDCANKCGKKGTRYISYLGHIKMMAAAQSFISGAISKTVNMPSHATIKDIEDAYLQSWKYMTKANAIYRSGSKLSEPLNATSHDPLTEMILNAEIDDIDETFDAKRLQEEIEKSWKPKRNRLPMKRGGFVQEAIVGGHKIFLRTGEYDDGSLGEIFIDMYKEGAPYKSLMNSFAKVVSNALQYGVPLKRLVEGFTFTRFEPSGVVQGHENIKYTTSILDFVFRVLGFEYLGRTDFLQVQPSELPTKKKIVKKKRTTVAEKIEQEKTIIENTATAKAQGFTGDTCTNCGSMKMKRNGACLLCVDCGETSGCS